MVEYYFDNEENAQRLFKVLEEWVGTPYRHKAGVKGLGCDCIHFVGRVMEELGLLNLDLVDDRFFDYPRDWHLHNTRERLSEAIEQYFKVEKYIIDTNPSFKFKNGDIALSHYGKASSHAAIYYNGRLYQSLNRIGVRRINAQMCKHMKFVYRLIK